jgi:acetyl esterase/lipase
VKKVFGINFKNVILTGDSAGGNLIIVMTLIAI